MGNKCAKEEEEKGEIMLKIVAPLDHSYARWLAKDVARIHGFTLKNPPLLTPPDHYLNFMKLNGWLDVDLNDPDLAHLINACSSESVRRWFKSSNIWISGRFEFPQDWTIEKDGAWSIASSKPSSPRNHHCETEGYNSADEQGPCYESSYDETEKEHKFEIDIRCAKGFEIRRMLEDGNCLFCDVADQL